MLLIQTPIKIAEVQEKHSDFFETMVKVVIDLERESLALNGEMHADLETLLLDNGSRQEDLWGANIYFKNPHDLEFTSLINIRPAQGNRSMELRDPMLRNKMLEIVKKLILI